MASMPHCSLAPHITVYISPCFIFAAKGNGRRYNSRNPLLLTLRSGRPNGSDAISALLKMQRRRLRSRGAVRRWACFASFHPAGFMVYPRNKSPRWYENRVGRDQTIHTQTSYNFWASARRRRSRPTPFCVWGEQEWDGQNG